MNEEQIIELARRRVGERRAERAQSHWNSKLALVLSALVVLVLIGFLAIPTPLPATLLLAMSGICALRPSHSYFAGALQLPLEARMLGIFAGALLTFLALLAFRRVGARHLGSRMTIGLLALAFATMVFDGVNSTLENIDQAHLYAPSNQLRLATGLLAGLALAVVLTWLLGTIATPRTNTARRAVIRRPWELVALLAVLAIFYWTVAREHPLGYYPIALFGAVGVIAVLAGTVLLFILSLGRLAGRVTRARQLLAPGALALLFAFAFIASAAALRWSVHS
jgi:uncharacterized membrane protein